MRISDRKTTVAARFIAGAMMLFGMICLPRGVCTAGEPIAVIVNRNNAVDSLSEADIRRIYTNNLLEWADGAPITIYDLSLQDNVRSEFSEKVLGKASYKVAEEWAHLKITNHAKNPPLTVKSQNLIIRKVASDKGAIGYVTLSAVRNNPGVKVIMTIQ